jgi:hypothetical protein
MPSTFALALRHIGKMPVPLLAGRQQSTAWRSLMLQVALERAGPHHA